MPSVTTLSFKRSLSSPHQFMHQLTLPFFHAIAPSYRSTSISRVAYLNVDTTILDLSRSSAPFCFRHCTFVFYRNTLPQATTALHDLISRDRILPPFASHQARSTSQHRH